MPIKSNKASYRHGQSYFHEGDPSTVIDDSRLSNNRITSMLENFPGNFEASRGQTTVTKETFTKRTQPTATVVHKRTSSINRSRRANNTDLMKASTTYQMPVESLIALSQARQSSQLTDTDQLFT
mmetsp:Transcript_12978/g.20115  ORF Transcript_12978/g.20115 Transcript_12978/m.20115 type:complete len:125 (+) Transcript_12978:3270-3644(+)